MFAAEIVDVCPDSITLAVSGHVKMESLPEIERLIDQRKRAVLDLSEVTLLDREAASFIAAKLSSGVEVVNCPPYITDWIPRDPK